MCIFYVDPEAPDFDKMTSILKVHLKDGTVIPGPGGFCEGQPGESHELRGSGRYIQGLRRIAKWPKDKAEGVINFVKTLENAPDITKVTALLTA